MNMTSVYEIDHKGIVSVLATYSLEPYEALKAAYLHKIKKYMKTWNYDKTKLDIKETSNGYYFTYNSGQLYTLKRVAIEEENKQDEYKIS